MKLLRIGPVATLVALALAGCTESTSVNCPGEAGTKDYKFYRDRASGFTVCRPPDWTVNRDAQPLAVVLKAPLEPNDVFQESLNVVLETVSPEMTTTQYADAGRAQVERIYPDAEFFVERPETFALVDGFRLGYEVNASGYQLSIVQMGALHDGHAFVATFSTLASAEEQYADVRETMLGSFRISGAGD